jgi:hypothetical protein
VPVLAWYRIYFQRERRAEDALGNGAAALAVLGFDPHLAVRTEPRMTPTEELLDHRLANPPLADKQIRVMP